MSEYTLDIYIIRTGLDYHSDIFDKLVVNGEVQNVTGEAWTIALRDWLNIEFELNTRARSMNSLEAVLRDAGYIIGFVEQTYVMPTTVVRRYKIKPLPELQDRYAKRHAIVREASRIIELAVGGNSELDMAREVEEACEVIMGIVASYEGHQIAQRAYTSPDSKNSSPLLADVVSSLQVGDKVHMSKSKGGDGVIVEFDRENRVIGVDFADHGQKFSIADFCRYLISVDKQVSP